MHEGAGAGDAPSRLAEGHVVLAKIAANETAISQLDDHPSPGASKAGALGSCLDAIAEVTVDLEAKAHHRGS